MHYAISTEVLGQTHMWYVLKHIRPNFSNFSLFNVVLDFYTHKIHKRKINNNDKNNAYKEMHDAQMHDNEASNT